MKKFLVYSLTTLTILGFLGLASVSVRAEGSEGSFPLIIQKIAEHFNLNIDEVQQVFQEAREEMRQEMPSSFKEKKGGCLCDDELTDEQKETLSVKREELKEEFESLKDLSQEERQSEMSVIREEMTAWAEENGIDVRCLGMFAGRFGKGDRGFGGGFRPGNFLPEDSE